MLTPIQNTEHILAWKLSQIKDVRNKNYQWDTLFIAKLILRDFDVAHNKELIEILRWTFTGDLYQDNEIKKYIVSLLPTVSFEFITNFLWEKNLYLIEYLWPIIEQTPYENIRPYVLKHKQYSSFIDYIIRISQHIVELDWQTKEILLDPNVNIFTRLEIYRKLNLPETDPDYWIIDKLPSDLQRYIENEARPSIKDSAKDTKVFTPDEKFRNNLWNIKEDGDKKAIVFYLRYHAIKTVFRKTLKELIRMVRFEIESWNTDFEKIVIVFRWYNHYDRSLVELIDDWNDVIQFAFVKWDDFQALINSPNRHMVHFTQSTPEELLDQRNGTSIITEEISDRFNFHGHWVNDYIELPWSAHKPKIMDEDWYINTFKQCFRWLSQRSNNRIIKQILNIIDTKNISLNKIN
jgi:hypothetical protein